MLFDVYIYLTFAIVFSFLYKQRFQDSEVVTARQRFIGIWMIFLLAMNAYVSFNTYLKSMFMTMNGSYS